MYELAKYLTEFVPPGFEIHETTGGFRAYELLLLNSEGTGLYFIDLREFAPGTVDVKAYINGKKRQTLASFEDIQQIPQALTHMLEQVKSLME